jgi:hypothetical protein
MTQTKAELLQTRHQGDIRLGDADSSHYVGFKAPATVGTSLVWTLPAADGTAGYYLKTDGSGNLGWSLDNSGVSLSGSTNNTIATVTGANALQGEANLTFDGSELKLPTGSGTQGLFFQASSGSNANLRGVGTNYGELGFFIGNNEKFRLDGTGRLLLGTTASRDNDVYFQIEGLGYQSATMQITRNSANADSGGIYLLKTRGTAVGQSTVVQSGDQLGIIDFRGADGTDGNTPAASIGGFVDGTPGANDMPGRLTFSTTADGANSATERMRITSTGAVKIGTTIESASSATNLVVHTPLSASNANSIEITQNTNGANKAAAGIGIAIANGGASTNAADLYFSTATNGSLGERLRIKENGALGIAGANYGTSGQVLTSGGSGAAVSWADAAGGGATPTVKTANYTAASGDLVVVNGSGLTITLPSSPSVADSVEIRILGSRYCTVARNGQNIESTASNFYIDTFDGHTKFIYTDSTRGWLVA